MTTPNLLLIEDNDLDARMLESALKKAAPELTVKRASDGESGLQAMSDDRPDMVFLDLSMPGLSGFQVLDAIRENDQSTNTPVIICSNSDDQSDVRASYLKRANAYVTKPGSGDGYAKLASSVARFWLESAKLPD